MKREPRMAMTSGPPGGKGQAAASTLLPPIGANDSGANRFKRQNQRLKQGMEKKPLIFNSDLRLKSTLALIALVVSFALPLTEGLTAGKQRRNRVTVEGSVLGEGWGLDHVGVFVRDLQETYDAYSDSLGFKIFPGGSFADGVRGGGVLLENNYLEVLTLDPGKASGQALDRIKFLKKHQGAVFLALNVSSAQRTAEFLRSRELDIKAPAAASITLSGETEPTPATFRIVALKRDVVPIETFFIEYVKPAIDKRGHRPSLDQYRQHPNTARRLRAVWIAVKDVRTATRSYESIGLQAGNKLRLKQINAKGREVQVGKGTLLLLEPDGKDGILQNFLDARGEDAIIGVSIEVNDLEAAGRIVSAAS